MSDSGQDEPVRDSGYDDLLDAIEEGEGYYLECPDGHGSLPPRRLCPECGDPELTEEPLPESGEIDTYTVTHVPTPDFGDDAPYALAVVNFGPVRLTGQLQGVDTDAVETGQVVGVDVANSETTGQRLLVFRER